MALGCPVDLNTQQLRCEVLDIYSRVAIYPGGDFHFHRGPDYAAEILGYDAAELASLPSEVTASFAGIGNPHAIEELKNGETVLDVGCGAGTDLLIAGRRVGSQGRVIGIDMTDPMVELARKAAHNAGLANIDVRKGDATALPLDNDSADVVISNGVLNLVPEKERAFAEIVRVLRPGGRVQMADIAVDTELSEDIRRNIDLWAG